MDRIYEDAKDLHVRNAIVYVKAAELSGEDGAPATGYAYEDKACTKKIKTSALKDLYLKGCVVCMVDQNDGLTTPIALYPGINALMFFYVGNGGAPTPAGVIGED